jgi:hypothetical protein
VLDQLVTRRVDLRAQVVMRALLGFVVVRHFWPMVGSDVTPVERFHVPFWSWLPVPTAGGYRALVWVGLAAGVTMTLALATSRAAQVAAVWATRVACAVAAYLVVLDAAEFGHNRAFLVWLLFGLSLLPAGATGPWWPVLMLRVIVSSVYLTSATTKLFNPDWRSGLVLYDRVQRYRSTIPFEGWPYDVVTSRAFHTVFSPAAIALELAIGFGFWFARTRLAAIWLALLFHLSIEIAAEVQTFSYSAAVATLLWVVPASSDRTLVASGWLRGVVTRLDWLQRFRIADPEQSDAVVLHDRGGRVRRGRDATLTTLSRLPLLFFAVGPVLLAHRTWTRRTAGRRGS